MPCIPTPEPLALKGDADAALPTFELSLAVRASRGLLVRRAGEKQPPKESGGESANQSLPREVRNFLRFPLRREAGVPSTVSGH
jgi:hypothetical protein